MNFSLYMEEWLYGKNGYYSSMPKIGKQGDFYTCVNASMFFGGSIANRLIKTIKEGFLSPRANIIEIGAHGGYLMADLIQFIFTLEPKLLNTLSFVIIEPFEEVRLFQKEYFEKSFGGDIEIKQYCSFDEYKFDEAFIFANEVFDSLPCEIIYDNKMLNIQEHEAGFSPLNDEVKKIISKFPIIKGEIPVSYDKFIKAMATSCNKLEAIFFDYGNLKHRNDMSIRVYKNHKTYPFFELTNLVSSKKDIALGELFGKSDLTYDVCFEYLINKFKEVNINLIEYNTQMKILIDFGIIDLLKILYKNVDEKIYLQEVSKAKKLFHSQFFGERFKGIIFRR